MLLEDVRSLITLSWAVTFDVKYPDPYWPGLYSGGAYELSRCREFLLRDKYDSPNYRVYSKEPVSRLMFFDNSGGCYLITDHVTFRQLIDFLSDVCLSEDITRPGGVTPMRL